jgi:micrococcal nuclease
MKKDIEKKELKKTIRNIIIMLLALFVLTLLVYFIKGKPVEKSFISEYKVTRIIDGDTFEIESGETVRLICVDSPEENQPGFNESKQFLEDLILNKTVSLKKDVSETDKYDRLLRYAYLKTPEKTVFINKELVLQGFATVFRVEPDIALCDEIGSVSE